MHIVPMPQGGLYRAGRWEDVQVYPPASRPIGLNRPLYDGFRWEDALGHFKTVKCSASDEAAIGRTIARYRPAKIEGHGVVATIKRFMSGPPDEGQPELVEGVVPEDVFDDLYSIHIRGDKPVVFVDISHQDTLSSLENQLSGTLSALGVGPLSANLAREPDRRVTRLVARAVYSICADGRYGPVAGIRCPGQPDASWESFVVWSPPELVDLASEDLVPRWVARWDPDLIAAARTLGLRLPDDRGGAGA